jgi:tRNA (adenine57-N1/adenine58-N1)-methyltransferase
MEHGGRVLVLIGQDGKRHILSPGRGVREVPGIGVVDTDRLGRTSVPSKADVAGREYLLAEATLPDILACLRRGAQIITAKDAAQIVLGLGIGPGSRVLEVGTGSAHLTVVLAHFVGPAGKVVTFESNPKHARLAAGNIRMAAMDDVVELREADAGTCGDESAYDAAVTDMPDPWSILAQTTRALVTGGRMCAYVPTMNQAETVMKAMRGAGYAETHVLENIQREIVVGPGGTRPNFEMLGHTGYLCFGRKTGT